MSAPYAEPVDFDEFWAGRYARAAAVDPAIERSASEGGRTLVRYTSLDGERIGGWLVLPEGRVRSAVIVGHGYGGRHDLEPEWVPDGAAAFYPVARGLGALSRSAGIPDHSRTHVLHGIDSRETYVHGGCVADLWVAVRAFQQLLGEPLGEKAGGLRLGYFGPSFGGGIGAMALPWEQRFDAASLYVPSFAANDRRLEVPCIGSGAAVARRVRARPETMDVLAYFDAEFAARRIAIPTLVAAALDDPSVPPVGQWAVAHAVSEEFRGIVSMTAGHRPYPEEEAELAAYAALTRQLFAAA